MWAQTLRRFHARFDARSRVAHDPVEFARRYDDPLDSEVAGLVASSLAFGNVVTLRKKTADALGRFGPSPAAYARSRSYARMRADLHDWRHRIYRGDDLARLVFAAGRAIERHGSLGALFCRAFAEGHGDLLFALDRFVTELRSLAPPQANTRGFSHLLADPRSPSAKKRLCLYLRWMVRPDDGVDLGLWSAVPPSALIIPLDTHVFRIARNLGLTKKKTASFEAAKEVTEALCRVDPLDPVKLDFALCHLGISRACPSRRDPRKCEGCSIRRICVHWRSSN